MQARAGRGQLAFIVEVVAVQLEHADAVRRVAAGGGVAGQHQAAEGFGDAVMGGVQGLMGQGTAAFQAFVAEHMELAQGGAGAVAVEEQGGLFAVAAVVGGPHAGQGKRQHRRVVLVDMVVVAIDAAVQEFHLVVVPLHDHRVAVLRAAMDRRGGMHQGEVRQGGPAFQVVDINP